jgi:hypothetical protein
MQFLPTGASQRDGSNLAEKPLQKVYMAHDLIWRSSHFDTSPIGYLYEENIKAGEANYRHYADPTGSRPLVSLFQEVRRDKTYILSAYSVGDSISAKCLLNRVPFHSFKEVIKPIVKLDFLPCSKSEKNGTERNIFKEINLNQGNKHEVKNPMRGLSSK